MSFNAKTIEELFYNGKIRFIKVKSQLSTNYEGSKYGEINKEIQKHRAVSGNVDIQRKNQAGRSKNNNFRRHFKY